MHYFFFVCKSTPTVDTEGQKEIGGLRVLEQVQLETGLGRSAPFVLCFLCPAAIFKKIIPGKA
ncbi:MAG: hypothetical protein WBF88_09380 [Pusillimonas sp.]